MCGRFTLRTPTNLLAEQFLFEAKVQLPLRFNIAPTQSVAAVRMDASDSHRQLAQFRWGLIPSWAKDRKIASRMINARAETVAEKPSFRAAFKRRRCLILADGYYEWQKDGKSKTPNYIRMKDDRPFAMAGLWESWRDEDDKPLETCTIITTTANELTSMIHDRMPVILEDADYDLWLDPTVQERGQLEPLLRPYEPADMQAHAISTHVNSVKNDDPSCIERDSR